MKKILNFEEYSNRTNEEWNGDNYPPGSDTPFAPWNYEEPEDTRKIDSSKLAEDFQRHNGKESFVETLFGHLFYPSHSYHIHVGLCLSLLQNRPLSSEKRDVYSSSSSKQKPLGKPFQQQFQY
jgi:hypothetical protein